MHTVTVRTAGITSTFSVTDPVAMAVSRDRVALARRGIDVVSVVRAPLHTDYRAFLDYLSEVADESRNTAHKAAMNGR